MKDKTQPKIAIDPKLKARRGWTEMAASIGMVLIAVGMFLPLLNLLDASHLPEFKWVFTAGALLFWGARCVNINAPDESLRIKRMRRMEFWAGACFGVAAFFWFYNENKLGMGPTIGPLAILRDPILFSLAGAVLQLIAAWMIYYRQKKETGSGSGQEDKK